MEKQNSIKRNYIYNLAYQILVVIIPLITTPYLSRALGAEAIGIYSYTLSITTYFILFGSLGVALYGQREIAYVQHDEYKRSKVFFEIFTMRFITLAISLIIFYFTFAINGEYSTYYKILILEIVANIIDISWFFQGLEEFKKTVIRNSLVKLISVICIFVFVKSSEDLYKYFAIYVLSNFLGNISLWMYLPKYIKKIKFKDLEIFKHLKPTISLFIPQIAIQVYTVLDKTMIGSIIEDKSEVGFYEQAQKMVKLLILISTSIVTVMVPRMANTYANGDNDKLKQYMINSFRFVLLLAFPLMLGMISVADKFVPIFYGEGYEKVTILLKIIIPVVLIIGLSNVIGSLYLVPTKKQKGYTISVSVGAVVNFAFNMIFIRLWGAIGASIATVIAETSVTGIQLYFVRNEIKLIDILKYAKKYFIASIIMFAIVSLLNYLIQNSIISIIVQVISGGIIYFVLLYIMKDEYILKGFEMVKNRVAKS